MAGTREQLAPPRRTSGARPAARTARRRRGRVRLTLSIALSLLVLVTAGVGWVYLKLGGDISTFSADGISGDRPAADASKGENVLVIGSDARTGGNSALGGGDKGDIGRSDTAFLLHVYADHRNAVAVSVPRDTLVTIPPCKLPDGSWTRTRPDTMFNAAYSTGETARGNPACTQNTVEKLTGLRVDHTVVVDFKGFAALTDVVGGVKVCLPQDIYQRDLNPHRTTRGKLLFARGEQTVTGQKALDYVRLRHGIGDGSDIGRIKRQQAFVGSLMKKVKSDGLTPTKLLPLAQAATRSMTVDPGLGSADKLLSFAMSLRNIDLHNTKFVTLPWRYEGSRVAVVEPDADALWAALKEDRTLDGKDASGKKGAASTASPTAAVNSASAMPNSGDGIRVTVYNGTAVPGLAAEAARTLTQGGFTVLGTATASSQNHATTLIQYGPGETSRARTVAERFPGARLEETATAGIKAIVGQDYADHPSAAAPTGPAPTAVPSEVSHDARSAADSLCSNLSYG
ncbi:LytR family transcriptional regulator [Streptomyces antnestii]|uniref:LytR family transcriptional regulator n=1 Tax=Streptomyces antnestii TaxID=2494256 RepID=A0A437Q2L9_9ACTN|nr:LCP family protein [Streptomyces sp. San01]RVU28746.1 LytR family transcriptional regulator [Streptomyces sp. San01]